MEKDLSGQSKFLRLENEHSSALVLVPVIDKPDMEQGNNKLMFDAMKMRPGTVYDDDFNGIPSNVAEPLIFSI